MGVTYYKRFRMEIDLYRVRLPEAVLPEGYAWAPWHPSLLERHSQAKFASFHGELDTDVFPCLGQIEGCRNLMSEIVQRVTFVPGATWLVSAVDDDGRLEDCATIQGVVQQGQWGSIQNVGVSPYHRGMGLGRALVLKALAGFMQIGVPRVYLEVTARNTPAVQLYRSIGFRLARTSYKAVDKPLAAYAVL